MLRKSQLPRMYWRGTWASRHWTSLESEASWEEERPEEAAGWERQSAERTGDEAGPEERDLLRRNSADSRGSGTSPSSSSRVIRASRAGSSSLTSLSARWRGWTSLGADWFTRERRDLDTRWDICYGCCYSASAGKLGGSGGLG